MDWLAIGKQLAGLGLPLLGTALLGPMGGAAGGLLAKALGLGDGATPAQVGDALANADAITIQRLKSAEAQYVAMVEAEAKVAGVQVAAVGETMRSEYAAAVAVGGWVGKTILIMQLSWRPAFAWQALIQTAGIGVVLFHEVWSGDFATLKALAELEPFLRWYLGLQFALLGVYSWGRTKEKIEAPQEPTPGLVDAIKRAVTKKTA